MNQKQNNNISQHDDAIKSMMLSEGKEPSQTPPPKPIKQEDPRVNDLNDNLTNMLRRLKLIEERYSTLRKKTQITDQNMLEGRKTIKYEIHSINIELTELKRNIEELSEKLTNLRDEMVHASKKTDLKILDKYLNYWEPMQFCTEADVKKIVQEILDKSNGSKRAKPFSDQAPSIHDIRHDSIFSEEKQ